MQANVRITGPVGRHIHRHFTVRIAAECIPFLLAKNSNCAGENIIFTRDVSGPRIRLYGQNAPPLPSPLTAFRYLRMALCPSRGMT
jgi:hypothetical protein